MMIGGEKTSWPLSSISFPSLNNFRTTNKFAPKANTHKDKNLTNRRTADLVRILNLVDRQDTSSTYYNKKRRIYAFPHGGETLILWGHVSLSLL